MAEQHFTVLIVGGGAAGVTVANTLLRHNKNLSVGLIEPSEVHYYQPGFTIVGGGTYTLDKTKRKEKDLLHPGVNWLKARCQSFQPDTHAVTLGSGEVIGYDYLVVCPGLQLDWAKIEGLTDTLGKNGVCSNYSPDTVEYTFECIKSLNSGTALFTQPPMPIKCAGAPQKIMYLAADRFRKQGVRDKIDIAFYNAGPGMFGVPFFAKALLKVVERYGIDAHFNSNLVAIDGPAKTATFEIKEGDSTRRESQAFDMIHVTPPQSAPDFIKNSPLANQAGWLEVHPRTLQHAKFERIFGLGDVTSTPNAKTAAAVRKQAPVVVDNILNLLANQPVVEGYDGYGSCPLTTGLNEVMLAEFAYDGKVTPSFPFLDPRTPRWLWWWGKTTGFPLLYWQLMLKGYRIDIPHRECYVKRLVEQDKS
ncbi:MAG: FAD/NAD(P)-binding oxidoreductase [Methylococcales bacterium]|nr:FAD/NAD(P)-binding oxidoreductase [Methylococcales bacterium]